MMIPSIEIRLEWPESERDAVHAYRFEVKSIILQHFFLLSLICAAMDGGSITFYRCWLWLC